MFSILPISLLYKKVSLMGAHSTSWDLPLFLNQNCSTGCWLPVWGFSYSEAVIFQTSRSPLNWAEMAGNKAKVWTAEVSPFPSGTIHLKGLHRIALTFMWGLGGLNSCCHFAKVKPFIWRSTLLPLIVKLQVVFCTCCRSYFLLVLQNLQGSINFCECCQV